MPLDWRAICNLDPSRLSEPSDMNHPVDSDTPGHGPRVALALHPEDTPALLQAALAATAYGDLDSPAAAAAGARRSTRLAALAPRGAVARLLDVAQAALQWGRWHVWLHAAAWRRTWGAARAALQESESSAEAIARLEHAVAEVRRTHMHALITPTVHHDASSRPKQLLQPGRRGCREHDSSHACACICSSLLMALQRRRHMRTRSVRRNT